MLPILMAIHRRHSRSERVLGALRALGPPLLFQLGFLAGLAWATLASRIGGIGARPPPQGPGLAIALAGILVIAFATAALAWITAEPPRGMD